MEWQNILHTVPIPAALAMVVYVNYKLKEHEKTCAFRDIIIHIKDKQADIDNKINMILEKLMNE